ncbi:MAG: ACP S-malonyltransferase [Phycisphaerales bacterium]|jgi:[acyl-carrier-protein] S-malonyltransferase|nr:ACP S-malonyltransferase [Phycisphaerales bacterium]MDP6693262.1 ACP S-malonyltransferase [Phycisphaerales bacterium]
MSEQVILLCPGQGAQKVGMGKAWHDSSPAAKAIFEEADEILGDSLDRPLSEICFEDPDGVINQTNISQPAIYTTSIASWHGLSEQGFACEPIATAGLSLGEYSALHLAGVFSFADGLKLVAKRGQLMQEAAETSSSTMIAVMGDDADILALCEEARGDDILVPANFNASGQIVLSGSVDACQRVANLASDRGVRGTLLSVAGAFHSPFMESAAEGMQSAFAETTLNPPTTPVWSNVTAEPHKNGEIADRLVQQITGSVRWAEQCTNMAKMYDGAWHELGPGSVLRGLMRRIDRQVKVQSHDEP